MLLRTVKIIVLTLVLVGCATTESSLGPAGAPDASSGSENSRASTSAPGTTADPPADSADCTSALESAPESAAETAPESVGAGTDNGTDPVPTAIIPEGLPLEEVMIPREGLRLVFDVAAPGGPDGTSPAELTLILQPSRSARADISIHAPGAEGYLIMEETDTLWRTALAAAEHPLTQALAEFAYPRYLPAQNQRFRSSGAGDEFNVSAVGDHAWELVYDLGTTVRIGNFIVEPMALDGGGPETIAVESSAGQSVRLTLRSAAVYREREITGAVVSAFGRPLSGVAVAPHPQVGRLPASRVAVTDAVGAFTLSYRAAPGDSIRLFFGRTVGSGAEERIATPQEIRGRVDSADFATLILTE